MSDWERVKVVVAGDSGVGKTALLHLICKQQPLFNPSYTVGCSLSVKVHEFRDRPCFIELWDVGGSNAHANTRSIFYQNLHGLILVYDCTNRKSESNLKKWMNEVLTRASVGTCVPESVTTSNVMTQLVAPVNNNNSVSKMTNLLSVFNQNDPGEQFFTGVRLRGAGEETKRTTSEATNPTSASNSPVNPGSTLVPVLVVGTKLDLLGAEKARLLSLGSKIDTKCRSSSVGFCEPTSHLNLNPSTTDNRFNCSASVYVSLPGLGSNGVDGAPCQSSLSSPFSLFGRRTAADVDCGFATENGLPEILINCNSMKDLCSDSSNSAVLDRFFADVIISKMSTSVTHSPELIRPRKLDSIATGTTQNVHINQRWSSIEYGGRWTPRISSVTAPNF